MSVTEHAEGSANSPGGDRCDTDRRHEYGVQFFVDLESRMWDALANCDANADHELLSADFVGVYPTGFATIGRSNREATTAHLPRARSAR